MSRFLSPNETFVGTTSGKDSYWDNVYANNLLSGNEGFFTQNVTAYEFVGIGKQLSGVFGMDITKLPLSGGLLSGPLTGTEGLFTISLSSPNLSGSFYGNGSGLTGVSGIDGSKLPLAGGVLSGPLTGTVGIFTTSLSAPNLSGNFHGDGSGLLGVSGIDGSKLPLAGGVLSGPLTGTVGIFTTSLSSPNLSGNFYGDGSGLTNVTGTDPTKLPLSGGRVDGNLIINGSLTALSSATFVNTLFATTSALSVINYGIGPALYVFQTSGPYDIASFYDQDYGEVFHIGNDGKVGVRESDPNKELTVNGEISAKSDIWADKFRGDGSLLTNVAGTDVNKLALSGGTLTGGLTGTVGLFTNSLSSVSISGDFFGNGSGLTNVTGTDVNKLPLSGGSLTGSLTGTIGLFTTSLSAPNLSGSFFGDGSGLTNLAGTDSNKLPLSGGTLTGGLTGTTAKFTSLSAESISGTFYGDLSNGINVPHYFATLRATASQSGSMNTSITPNTFTYTASGALAAIESVTPTVGDIILFTGQGTTTQNGPWKVVNSGSIGIQAVLERPSFYSGSVKNGTMFSIIKGTTSHGFIYVVNAASGGGTADISVGSTNLSVTQAYARNNTNAVLFANTFSSTQTLGVGTTTTAPLRFQAGTVLTAPIQHSVEWDGNFMYLTTSGANSARTTNVAFVSAPATSSSYGLAGQVAYDSTFFYVCTAANTWLKTPLTTSGIAIGLDGTKLPLSGGALTGTLTGTVGLFTTSLSAPSLSGSFFGNGSGLINVIDGTKLPLSGGALTGSLTGTTSLFTTSISSVSISGTHFGDGSRLTGIPSSGLPLSGGTLTGGLTGTTGLFTTSISSVSLSGTHFGDGSKLTGISSGLPLNGGTLTGGLTGTTATFTTSISSPIISGTFYGDGSNIISNTPAQINFIFDGGGSAVSLNSTGIVQIPYNIKIISWTILANAQANAEVQVLTSNYSNHPTYSIISGTTNTPKLINASKAQSSTMSDWVTAIPADSYLQFTVISNDSAINLTVSLKCLRTN
jgi:hypothetical protein